jgi:hypothetical protein
MKKKLSLAEYVKREIEQILSPLNIWGTGEKLGRPINPGTPEDNNALVEHWVNSGGLNCFTEEFEIAA